MRAEIGDKSWEAIKQMNFASRWQYVTDHHQPADLLEENYFHGVPHIREPGDRVYAVCRFEDGSWGEAELVVVRHTPKSTSVELVGDWRYFQPDTHRTLKIVNSSPGRFNVVDADDGTLVAKGVSKDEAERLVGGGSSEVEKAEATETVLEAEPQAEQKAKKPAAKKKAA